ncbi:hypothetical protein AVEN_241827-1, partial [Araneus ventricosus]
MQALQKCILPPSFDTTSEAIKRRKRYPKVPQEQQRTRQENGQER